MGLGKLRDPYICVDRPNRAPSALVVCEYWSIRPQTAFKDLKHVPKHEICVKRVIFFTFFMWDGSRYHAKCVEWSAGVPNTWYVRYTERHSETL